MRAVGAHTHIRSDTGLMRQVCHGARTTLRVTLLGASQPAARKVCHHHTVIVCHITAYEVENKRHHCCFFGVFRKFKLVVKSHDVNAYFYVQLHVNASSGLQPSLRPAPTGYTSSHPTSIGSRKDKVCCWWRHACARPCIACIVSILYCASCWSADRDSIRRHAGRMAFHTPSTDDRDHRPSLPASSVMNGTGLATLCGAVWE